MRNISILREEILRTVNACSRGLLLQVTIEKRPQTEMETLSSLVRGGNASRGFKTSFDTHRCQIASFGLAQQYLARSLQS